jgi:uncharacterized protein (TIGR02453 family)
MGREVLMADEATNFTGFGREAFTFLTELAAKQDRAWFEPRKALYETAVRGPMVDLMADLVAALAARRIPLRGDPARAVFRIHRDVRFSREKLPYKTNVGGALTRDGGKMSPGVLYVHIDPGGSFAAVGFYRPEPAALGAIRTRIATKPAIFRSVLNKLDAAGLPLDPDDDALKRTPRGFEHVTDPDIADALRRRSLIVRRPFSRADAGKKALVGQIVAFAEAAHGLLDFGWKALDALQPGEEPVRARKRAGAL